MSDVGLVEDATAFRNGPTAVGGLQQGSAAGLKRVFIKSFGCQMNAYDADRMADVLAREGYAETGTAEAADLVILNTCHIRERASEKVFSELGRLRELKDDRARQGGALQLVVAGCVAQAEGTEIVRRQRAVDVVVGPQSYHRLPGLLRQARDGRPAIDTEFPLEDKLDHVPAPSAQVVRGRGVAGFVTIQEGCDKFCSFCVVPYTRGAETSRPPERIVAEVRRLAAAGVREVTLLGQNVNAYHGVDAAGAAWSLARLIRALATEPGLARLRYTTSHPNDMDGDLIAAHAEVPSLMPFLHLPVQSGSDRMLEAMNRKHTAADYLALIGRVRAACPDVALSSDFIVGFPGESDADFEDTLDLVRRVDFASTFFFAYSARAGTPGADLPGQVADTVKRERLARLSALVESQRHAFNRSTVGRTLPVLVEKMGRHAGQLAGKTPYLQPVHIDGGPELIGQVLPIAITSYSGNSLFGEVVRNEATMERG